MLEEWDSNNIDIMFDEDADLADIMEIMNVYHDGLFDESEMESLKYVMKNERVAYPRQMGDWITLSINGEEKSVTCNCERCNFGGRCEYVVTFESLQFGKKPPIKCKLTGETFDWENKVMRAIDTIKRVNIDV